MAAVFAVVFIFTAPWDNYAAKWGIWGFPEKQYSVRIGYLPLEEYLFFFLQSFQAILITWLLLQWQPELDSWSRGTGEQGAVGPWTLGTLIACGVLSLLWVVVGVLGRKIHAESRWHYAWHLLFWFLPIIGFQWIIAWEVILPRWHTVVIPCILLGSWLSFADWIAVRQGIWFFDEKQITGWKWKGVLPWEEIAFFFLTSFLVAQSFLILLPEELR